VTRTVTGAPARSPTATVGPGKGEEGAEKDEDRGLDHDDSRVGC